MAKPIDSVMSLRTRDHLLRLTARHLRDDLVVLTARGEIDLSNTWRLADELAHYEHVPHLVVDLSGVGFCGVSGARLLHTAFTRSLITGQRLEVVHSTAVSRVLDATGLGTHLPSRAPATLDRE